QVDGHREDFQAVLLRQVHALPGHGFGAGVSGALIQVEVRLPAGLFPAIEAGLLDELHPLVEVDVAELPADQADLMIRSLAEAVRRRWLEAHDLSLSKWHDQRRAGALAPCCN